MILSRISRSVTCRLYLQIVDIDRDVWEADIEYEVNTEPKEVILSPSDCIHRTFSDCRADCCGRSGALLQEYEGDVTTYGGISHFISRLFALK